MRITCGEFEIDDDLSRIDFERVHCWLASTYWSPGIPREKVEKAAGNSSMVIGGYINGVQAGYMRVISDKTTFAWLCDVFVDEDHRGLGIARGMVRFAQAHPDYQGLRRWVLATKDAHSVYASAGFVPVPEPQRWMIYLPPVVP